ncbi:MAG: ParA family protein [Neisseria animaloris]|nr:ParA family protein [Neisseria animaloris]
MIISFLNQKGGVGKSTLSYNVAFEISRRGKRVLFIDSDPQGSASQISTSREEPLHFPMVSIAHEGIGKEIKKFVDYYDVIVVDGIPELSKTTQATALVSNVIVVPMTVSGVDLRATGALIEMLNNVSVLNPDMVVGVVLNQYSENVNLTKDVLAALENTDWQVFDTRVARRIAYAESGTYGLAVSEMPKDKGKKATQEVESLVNEILELE